MGQVGTKLRSIVGGLAHWCPGCRGMHQIAIDAPNSSGAKWTWDGNIEAPTFAPSVHVKVNTPDMPEYQPQACSSVCHYFLRAGEIEFLPDCTHALKGQRVPLPALPLELTDRYLGT
jgi:hypothetical protein